MILRLLAETATTATLGWDADSRQEGYVPTIDGSETLTDGKRHASTSKTQTQVRIAKPADGQPHAYGVRILGITDEGSITVPAPPPSSPPGIIDYPSLIAAAFSRPAFVPLREVSVASAAQLATAVANLKPGDLVKVSGPFTVSGEFVIAKQLAAVAEIQLAGVHFTGNTDYSQLPAVWVNNCRNVRAYDGEVSNPGGPGIVVYDGDGFTWQGFKVHDCGDTGLYVQGIHSSPLNHVLEGELWNNGLHLAFDPHAEEGTGLHGVYFGGASYDIHGGKFALHVHDQPYGAAVQVNDLQDSRLWALAERCTFNAQSQTAGNALQLWGAAMSGLTVEYIEGDDLAGAVVHTKGGLSSITGLVGSAVKHGRHQNVNTNPKNAGNPVYDPYGGMTFEDCL